MSKKSRKELRDKLKNRTQKGAQEREQSGMGKKTVLDYTKTKKGLKVSNYDWEPDKGEEKQIDMIPYVITQTWYKKLRMKSGSQTGLDVGDEDYKLELPVHKNIGDENATFLCLRLAFGGKCPVCEELMEEWDKKKNDQDKDRISELKPSWRCAYNVFDYDDQDAGIQLWDDQSFFLFEDFLLENIDADPDGLSTFWDLEEGQTISYKTRTKKLGDNKFQETNSIDFIEREAYEEDILEKTHPLDAMVTIPTYDEVANAFLGLEGGEEEEEEESRSRKKPRRIKDEDEEEEKPRGKKRKTGKDKKKAKKSKKVECPFGHDIGVDLNDSEDCEDCPKRIFKICSDLWTESEEVGGGKDEEPRCDECGEFEVDCTCEETCEECGELIEDCTCEETCDECGELVEDCTCEEEEEEKPKRGKAQRGKKETSRRKPKKSEPKSRKRRKL